MDYFPGIFRGPFYEKPKSFDLGNLPCPPQSLLDAQETANEVGFRLPARPGYAPIIAPPPALQNLEPAWKWCTTQFAFDPPRALTPATAMVPRPTPTDQAGPQKIPAMPSPTLVQVPAQTQSLDPPADPPAPMDSSAAEDPPNNSSSGKGSLGNPNHSPNGIDDVNSDPSDPNPGPLVEGDPPQADPETPSNPSKVTPGEENPLPAAAVVTIGHQTFTALPTGGFKAAGATIQPGDPTVTIQGTPVWLGSSMLLAGSSTVFLPKGDMGGPLTAEALTFAPLGEGAIVLQGNTLSANGLATTISGKAVSLDVSGLVIDGQTFAIPRLAPEAAHPNSVLTVAGHTVSRDGSSKIYVDGVMLEMNGQAKTVSGTVLSLMSGSLIINGQKYPLPTPAPTAIPGLDAVYTLAGQTITFFGGQSAIIDGTLFSVNGPAVTIPGTTVSLASASLLINGQSYALPAISAAIPSSAVTIDGKVLQAGGPAVTVSGHLLELVSGDSGLYLIEVDDPSSVHSIPVIAGESMTMDTFGKPVDIASSETSSSGVDGQSLGSLLMFGFGQHDQTSAATITSSATRVSAQDSTTSATLSDQSTGDGARNRPLLGLKALCTIFLIGALTSYT